MRNYIKLTKVGWKIDIMILDISKEICIKIFCQALSVTYFLPVSIAIAVIRSELEIMADCVIKRIANAGEDKVFLLFR